MAATILMVFIVSKWIGRTIEHFENRKEAKKVPVPQKVAYTNPSMGPTFQAGNWVAQAGNWVAMNFSSAHTSQPSLRTLGMQGKPDIPDPGVGNELLIKDTLRAVRVWELDASVQSKSFRPTIHSTQNLQFLVENVMLPDLLHAEPPVTIDDIEIHLTSAAFNVPWMGPVAMADHVPIMTNKNGIYAVKAEHQMEVLNPSCPVYGVIELQGRVLVGKWGYRAEKGVIQHLSLITNNPGVRTLARVIKLVGQLANEGEALQWIAQQLEKRYQCDVDLVILKYDIVNTDYFTGNIKVAPVYPTDHPIWKAS